jgi:hypothetical protein
MPKRWACVFAARSGGQAQAAFDSRDEAKRFAERHARAFVHETPLLWRETAKSSALETPIGEYLVTHIDEAGDHTNIPLAVGIAQRVKRGPGGRGHKHNDSPRGGPVPPSSSAR